MLISPVIPLMSVYRLPYGQYGYSGHVINFPQDVSSFINSLLRLPTDLNILIVRKEGSSDSHRDFCVRRSKVLRALQWLVMHDRYFSNITINYDNLSSLPEDDHITNMPSISVPCGNEEPEMFTNTTEDPDLSRTFVPSVHQNMTKEDIL